MNRRHFLTTALAVPAAVALPSVVEAAEFDFGRATHKPMTDEERMAIDGMSEEELMKFRSAFAESRLKSMTGRCNATYTMGACYYRMDRSAVDADFIKSSIPRLNAGLQADFDNVVTPVMRHALSRIMDESSIAPLTVTGFVFDRLGRDSNIDGMNYHFVHLIPGHSQTGKYVPFVVHGYF